MHDMVADRVQEQNRERDGQLVRVRGRRESVGHVQVAERRCRPGRSGWPTRRRTWRRRSAPSGS
eukprot:1077046-Pyramimonas_sp.AAC.1